MTYIPAQFHVSDEQTLTEFMRAYDFATIVSNSPEQLVASHVPVLVHRSGANLLITGHLARANTHWQLMDGKTPAVVIFHGPHGYISPTWYATSPAVPTWNYGLVHAHGIPRTNNDRAVVRSMLEELAQRYEENRPERWDPQNLPPGFYDDMLCAIVAFEMPVTKLEGKFKLGQNRSIEDRQGTIAGLRKESSHDAMKLAEFMSQHAFDKSATSSRERPTYRK